MSEVLALSGLSLAQLVDRLPTPPLSASPTPSDGPRKSPRAASSGTRTPTLRMPSAGGVESPDDEQQSTPPSTNYEDLLNRAAKGVIGQREQTLLFRYLVQLSETELMGFQARALDLLANRNLVLKNKPSSLTNMLMGDRDVPAVEVLKYTLDFGSDPLPLMAECTDNIVLIQKNGKVTFNFLLPSRDPRFDIRINPSSGKIKPGKPGKEEVMVSVVCKTTLSTTTIVTMEIEGGGRHYFVLRIRSQDSLFGMTLNKVEFANDTIFNGQQVRGPKVLVKLRRALVKGDGLIEPNLFRQAPDEGELLVTKLALTKGTFKGSASAHVLANLVKVWLRDLPEPLLNSLPTEAINGCETEARAAELAATLPEPQMSVLTWLVELLCSVAMFEDENKMSVRALATVVGPNLYFDDSTTLLSAMESLRFSQQLVAFLGFELTRRLRVLRDSRASLAPIVGPI